MKPEYICIYTEMFFKNEISLQPAYLFKFIYCFHKTASVV